MRMRGDWADVAWEDPADPTPGRVGFPRLPQFIATIATIGEGGRLALISLSPRGFDPLRRLLGLGLLGLLADFR